MLRVTEDLLGLKPYRLNANRRLASFRASLWRELPINPYQHAAVSYLLKLKPRREFIRYLLKLKPRCGSIRIGPKPNTFSSGISPDCRTAYLLSEEELRLFALPELE